MKLKLPLLFALLLCASAATAATISGTFLMNGVVTATTTAFDWFGVNGTTPNVFNLSLGTGSYVAADGTDAINNLNSTTEPVGVPISPPADFIDFTAAPSLPPLLLSFIVPGNGGATGCTAAPVGSAPPQTCTLAGSPVTFQNNDVGGTVTASSATWTFDGITNGGASTWTGVFTAQFNEPFQSVLATLGTTGSVTTSYSANVVVTAVPEPETLLLGGVGFLFTLLCLRRRKSA